MPGTLQASARSGPSSPVLCRLPPPAHSHSPLLQLSGPLGSLLPGDQMSVSSPESGSLGPLGQAGLTQATLLSESLSGVASSSPSWTLSSFSSWTTTVGVPCLSEGAALRAGQVNVRPAEALRFWGRAQLLTRRGIEQVTQTSVSSGTWGK